MCTLHVSVKKCLKRCENNIQTTQWKSYYEQSSIASITSLYSFLLLRISAMEVAHTRFEQMRWSGGSTQSLITRSPSWIRPIAERTLHIMVERRLLQRKHHPYSRRWSCVLIPQNATQRTPTCTMWFQEVQQSPRYHHPTEI